MIWRDNDVFSSMALYDLEGPGFNICNGDFPEEIKGAHVSADYCRVFGISPVIGRAFNQTKDLPNGPKAAPISENLWRSQGGIVLCSFFALGRNSLLPCVLLHTAFNASTGVYFGSYNRVNDTGSYVAETVFTLVVAVVVFRLATRKGGNGTSAIIGSSHVSAWNV
jgi:hypothetical protein